MSPLRADGGAAAACFAALADLRRPWVERCLLFGGRAIPVVSARLSRADRLGCLKAHWGIGRMRYAVLPGLYAVGQPDSESPVFVSANYKMSFDVLRSSLRGVDAWILALDTKGINVWCAAGKGTFGTEELVSRMASVRLSSVVSHRTVVLPQLGASGVSATEVAKRSPFRVEWGPVRAQDIPAWLAAGRKKDAAMREVTFALADRMAVAPVEIAHSWPVLIAAAVLASLYGLPAGPLWLSRAAPAAVILAGIVPVGTILFPALLPWIPSRAFSVKGSILGAAWAAGCAVAFRLPLLAGIAATLTAAPVAAFLAMNFTGSSTFTSQGGARLEVERGFWPMALSLAAGLAVAAAARVLGL